MKKTMTLVLVLALGMIASIANADFTFSEPTPVQNVSTSEAETGSSISTDGLELYFYSERPGGYGGSDLYVAKRQTTYDDWNLPVNLGPTVNSPHGEYDPIISGDGLTLYFSDGLWDVQRPRPGGFGGGDIWITRRETIYDPWGVPENLGEGINTTFTESGPYIAPDESYIIFNRYRSPTGDGLHISFKKKDGTWSQAIGMGSIINPEYNGFHGHISPNSKYLFFTSKQSPYFPHPDHNLTYDEIVEIFNSPLNGSYNIYWVDAKIIEQLNPNND